MTTHQNAADLPSCFLHFPPLFCLQQSKNCKNVKSPFSSLTSSYDGMNLLISGQRHRIALPPLLDKKMEFAFAGASLQTPRARAWCIGVEDLVNKLIGVVRKLFEIKG